MASPGSFGLTLTVSVSSIGAIIFQFHRYMM